MPALSFIKERAMFRKSAHLYDAIYEFMDYPGQAEKLRGLIDQRHPGARSLLDVACGTGLHLGLLREHFERVEGLDLDPGMLEIARERLPGVALHEGNMTDFRLGSTFDVVTCLFSSIGYAGTVPNLGKAVGCMASHVGPGGLVLVAPWLFPENWIDGHVGMDIVDEPERKIARLNRSVRDGRQTTLQFQYVVVTPAGFEHLEEKHVAYMFTKDEYESAFEAAGLDVEFDPDGLIGRGMFIGTKR